MLCALGNTAFTRPSARGEGNRSNLAPLPLRTEPRSSIRGIEHGNQRRNRLAYLSSKVQGTNVYNTDGNSLGEVYDVMIDELSGKVAYAIVSFGGFLGVGGRYHPLPWNTLKYDTRQGGYVVGLTLQQLEGAPTYARTETPAWGDRAYETSDRSVLIGFSNGIRGAERLTAPQALGDSDNACPAMLANMARAGLILQV